MLLRRETHVEGEARRPTACLEVFRCPVVLDDRELSAVRHRPYLPAVVGRVAPRSAVDQEDASARTQGRPGERPELVESLLRHVRKPEGEEDDVEQLLRAPRKNIGLEV